MYVRERAGEREREREIRGELPSVDDCVTVRYVMKTMSGRCG